MKKLLIIMSIVMGISGLAYAQTESVVPDTLSISNAFIKIVVNNKVYDRGRFAIETEKGDPRRTEDDQQPLIFGRPKPWTSYTTIRVDDKDYVFGGNTLKRAGKTALYGPVLDQVVTENAIITKGAIGDTIVTQTLRFFRNPSSRVEDVALIQYELYNHKDVTQNIGLRIMMDTMLGSNDGAPFRIGTAAVQSEKRFMGKDVLSYWQTFDDLASPNVVAQGVLAASSVGINPPDQMALVNWGTLADAPWDYDYEPGRSFVRAGEFDKDTALALYWNPVDVAPGKTIVRRTLYGMGGVDLAPGALSLGLTAPAEVSVTDRSPLLIVGYLLNTGGFDSKSTKVTFTIPKGFEVLEGSLIQTLDLVGVGESRQVLIKIRPTNKVGAGMKQIRMSVSSDTLEDNSISRDIDVIGPPEVSAKLTLPKQLSKGTDSFFTVRYRVHNPNAMALMDMKAALSLPKGFQIPAYETKVKPISNLPAGGSIVLNWQVNVRDWRPGNRLVKVTLTSPLIVPVRHQSRVRIQVPKSRFRLVSSRDGLSESDYFYVQIMLDQAAPFSDQSIQLKFDSKRLKLVRWSPSAWMIDTGQTDQVSLAPSAIDISGLTEKTGDLFYRPIIKAHFKTLQPGKAVIELLESTILLDQLNMSVKGHERIKGD
ncbi:hypothetical protein HOH87_08080 [bacterium]|nr:hypothetical protein [bacterium]